MNEIEQKNHDRAHYDAVHYMNLYNIQRGYNEQLEKQIKEWRNIAYQFYKTAQQSKTSVLLAEKTLSIDECMSMLENLVTRIYMENK